MTTTLKKLQLLLYKNFLILKNSWKKVLFFKILMTICLIFLINQNMEETIVKTVIENQSYPIEPESHFKSLNKQLQLYMVPNNSFIDIIAEEVQNCFTNKINVTKFQSEIDMLNAYKKINKKNSLSLSMPIKAVVFDQNITNLTKKFKYKLYTEDSYPTNIYRKSKNDDLMIDKTVALQMCFDKLIIGLDNEKLKTIEISMEKMITPNIEEINFNQNFNGLKIYPMNFILVFQSFFELEILMKEKSDGASVLMSMNGVSNYLYLSSILLTDLLTSHISIVSIFKFMISGNLLFKIVFGFMSTLCGLHFCAFEIHFSAYFKDPQVYFGLLSITNLILTFGISYLETYHLLPYLGLLFPQILFYILIKKIFYYQAIEFHWSNLFEPDPIHGMVRSSIVIMIFFFLGAILNLILAEYIYSINPGKYGTKKHPLYFLKFLKKHNDSIVSGNDLKLKNDRNTERFEKVPESFTPGIELRNLKKTYDIGFLCNMQMHALKGINVDFYRGQITAILGHNGAGKTTMISILTGMISPTEGDVIVNGKNIKDDLNEVLCDIGLCPQENIVFPQLTVYQQLEIFAKLKNKNNLNKEKIKDNIESILRKIKLFEKKDVLPKKLSGGQIRRLCFGMTLVGDSSTLIFDEPTSGLDPEIKRDIWNILLKIKKEKTILLSTHDMEEADILGDRIAIVHDGELIHYGTSTYLKMSCGNLEVTLSTKSWSNPEDIQNYLDQQSKILNVDGNKIVISVPNTSELPNFLDKIENYKDNLGITGTSVSMISLEQVFIKSTTKNEMMLDSKEILTCSKPKLNGLKHSLQAAKGSLYKNFSYTMKNMDMILLMIFNMVLGMIIIGYLFLATNTKTDSIPINLQLDIYNDSKVFYKNDEESNNYGIGYKIAAKYFGAEVIQIAKTNNLSQEILNYGNKNHDDYEMHVISAADFVTDKNFSTFRANAIYNDVKASFAKPISMNLMSNSILKAMKGSDYIIETILEKLPILSDNEKIATTKTVLFVYLPFMILSLCFLGAIPHLMARPISERVSKIKSLQKITGLSWFNYWGTMFLVDFLVMIFLSTIVIVGFVVIDFTEEYILIGLTEILLLSLLLIIFSISVLPCVYCFTFWFEKTTHAMILFNLVNYTLISLKIGSIFLRENIFIVSICKSIEFLIPFNGLLTGGMSFLKTSVSNSACLQLSKSFDSIDQCHKMPFCCDMQCKDGVCKNPQNFFNDFKDDLSLEAGFVNLILSIVFYVILLWCFENKIYSLFKHQMDFQSSDNLNQDEQVERVKKNVANEISNIKTKTVQKSLTDDVEIGLQSKYVFLAYELKKIYNDLIAVKDVSFGVKEKQCFGLLGVNGAGKSTTFNILTGEIKPNRGTMFLNKIELTASTGRLNRSSMGYCPQMDTLIPCLNAYDHLKLFGRLRGIPESVINSEVNKWIKLLNLTACASRPSSTYSGGNKRKLNFAMSIIGVPKLLLLDEPTSGIDPAARRSLWNVIKHSQKSTGQAVILTSHSMDESEALSNQLAIMVNGEFVCIGASEELKQRFGTGYDLQMKLNHETNEFEIKDIKNDIERLLHCELVDENSNYLKYHVFSSEKNWKEMYDIMNTVKNNHSCIENFTVLSSTLEQLFLFFAKKTK